MTITATATIRDELRAALDALPAQRDGLVAREAALEAVLEALAKAMRHGSEPTVTHAALMEEVERKNRELEAFSYAVSHDLRAPLRSIDGFSQAIAEESTELSPRSRHDLQRIRTAAQHMGALIDDLLQLSRVGRAEMDRSAVDLAEIARGVGAALQSTQPERRVELEIEGPLIATADRRLMRVALENLLGNAWKFTAAVPQARVQFHSQRTANGLAFVVRDNGAGFPMNYVGKLFRPFQRLHMASEFSGTGIGLAMVHRIIDRHGGRVWAEGAEGSGAAIYFTIPQGQSGGLS